MKIISSIAAFQGSSGIQVKWEGVGFLLHWVFYITNTGLSIFFKKNQQQNQIIIFLW